jgi:hypothetical protein
MPISSGGPLQIASGPGGDLWTTDLAAGSIGQITPEGKIVEHLLPGPGYGSFSDVEPYGAIAGPDGAFWFAEQNSAAIGRITPAGELQTFPIPAAPAATVGGIGYPQPRSLAIGPEGAIWFTDPGTNAIGRVTGDQVSEFPIVGAEAAVPDTIVSFGGELWFNEDATPSLGSVNPGLPAIEEKPKAVTILSAEVSPMLTVSGSSATIRKLLKNDGYTTKTTLPAAGTVTITWQNSKHTTVATGKETLGAAGTRKLKIKLTSAGKKLLKKSKTLKMTAKGTVTLTGTSAVTATKVIAVKH